MNTSLTRLWRGAALGLLLVLHVPVAMAQAALLHSAATPTPALTPEQVVRIQLESLRANDADNAGIEIAFRFASPSNKRATGPLPRFISMLEAGPYALMLGYRDVEYAPPQVSGDRARQQVTLYGASEAVSYVFYLSRQAQAPCAGCWMTDAVTIEPVAGKSV